MNARVDRVKWRTAADGFAAAVVFAIPWSTSAAYILMGGWLFTLLATIEPDEWRSAFRHPAAWLPVALLGFAASGTLWATGIDWSTRWEGFNSFAKLITIPLLLIQFRTSPRANWVFVAFLVSCSLLLLASWTMVVTGIRPFRGGSTSYGVPVRDYIVQSQEFILCAVGLMYAVYLKLCERRYAIAFAFAALVALFLINVTFVAPSRTGFVTVPALLVILLVAKCRWQVSVAAALAIVAGAAVMFAASPKIQTRILGIVTEIQDYRTRDVATSAGERYYFWTTSIGIMAAAPVIGHGTGSIHEQFIRAAAQDGSTKPPTTNPHNQTLTIAIQLGLVGVVLLFAMWASHALLFLCGGYAGWIGLAVVAQNVIGSLFNNHLFDFTQSWIYMFGVGVAGGVALSQRSNATRRAAPQVAGSA